MSQTIEVNLAVKVRIVEDLHGNLIPSLVELLEDIVLDSNVGLDVPARQNNLFIASATDITHDSPVGDGGGQTRNHKKEDIGLEASAVEKGQKPFEDIGYSDDKTSQVEVVKRATALCEPDKRRVLDSWRIGDAEGRHKNPTTGVVGSMYISILTDVCSAGSSQASCHAPDTATAPHAARSAPARWSRRRRRRRRRQPSTPGLASNR